MKIRVRFFLLLAILGSLAPGQENLPQLVVQTTKPTETGTGLVFGPSNRWLASIDRTGEIGVYDLERGRIARVISVPGASNGLIAAHHTRDLVAVTAGGAPGTIGLINVSTGQTIWSAANNSLNCTNLHFTDDGASISAVCSEVMASNRFVSYSIKTWDTETGTAQAPRILPDRALDVRLSSDGKWYAVRKMPTVSQGLKVAGRSMLKGIVTRSVIGTGASDEPNPGLMTTSSIFETTTGNKVLDVNGMVVAMAPRQSRVAIATPQSIELVDVRSGKRSVVSKLGPIESYTASASFSTDASFVLLSGFYHRPELVDCSTGQKKPLNTLMAPGLGRATLSPDDDLIAWSDLASISLFKISDPSYVRTLGTASSVPIPSMDDQLRTLSTAPISNQDKKELAKLSKEYMERIVKAKGAERDRLNAEFQAATKAVTNKNQKAELDLQKELFDYYSQLGVGVATPPMAAFVKDGSYLLVRGADFSLNVWDVETGNRLPYQRPFNYDSDATRRADSDLFSPEELKDVETKLTGTETPSVPGARQPMAQGGGEVACSSANARFAVLVTWASAKGSPMALGGSDKKQLQTAILYSRGDGSGLDLLKLGLDLSAFTAARPAHDHSITQGGQSGPMRDHLPLCALSPDGKLLAIELLSPAEKPHNQSAGSIFKPRAEDFEWKTTSDNLAVFELPSGRELSKLDKAPGQASFDIAPGELHFSPDGNVILGGTDLDPTNALQRLNLITTANKRIRVWEARTGRSQSVEFNGRIVGFSADGLWYMTTGASSPPGEMPYGVDFRAVQSGRFLFSISDIIADSRFIFKNAAGTVIAGPDRENGLGFWDSNNGQRLGSLRALQQGEWLVTTPEGLFDGSPRGWTQFAWRTSQVDLTTASPEIFFNEFYHPGLLADLIAGRHVRPSRSITQVDRRQPAIRLEAAAVGSEDDSANNRARIDISVAEEPAGAGNEKASGVRDVRLFRNNILIKAWRGDIPLKDGKAVFDLTVPLTSGENRFVAYAFNRDNVKSADASAVLQSSVAARKGTAYILAIGVNAYQNREFDLKFAVPDAQLLSGALRLSEEKLGQYEKVVSIPVLDTQATRANILYALERLGGRSGIPPASAPAQFADLEPAKPEDSVVIYFAGHGFAANDHFYLVPHDFGYSGQRRDLAASLDRVMKSSISDTDLERALEPVDAGHILLIVDACNSGKALDSEEERRGPMNNRGLAQLAYEKGIDILTAAQAYQAALESSRLGHGYLTYALVEEGLASAVADIKPRDNVTTAQEWFEFATGRVPQLQAQAIKEAAAQGRLFSFVSDFADHRGTSGLQTPRFYYRRDSASAPMVVARFKGVN
jgi:WD40 repeat protein/uncharacterized caspase-like protein